jgi:hypothetical protein
MGVELEASNCRVLGIDPFAFPIPDFAWVERVDIGVGGHEAPVYFYLRTTDYGRIIEYHPCSCSYGELGMAHNTSEPFTE